MVPGKILGMSFSFTEIWTAAPAWKLLRTSGSPFLSIPGERQADLARTLFGRSIRAI